MGIEAIYRRPNTSKPAPGHKIYPYLLRGLAVERPNQVWAMDITYIPMARGFVYLAAVVDWFSRRVLAWRVSITMEVDFCLEALEEALARHGKPEIFNTDQGSQFTSAAFTGLLLENGIAISMDGKGAWRDNVFVERLWRSVKYEEVYLRAYDSVGEARASLGRYLDFYNRKRPHSSLDARTPDDAYFDHLPHARRRHEFRRRCRGVTPVGLRPPCATPRQRHITQPTGRGSTYRRRNAVATKPATSELQLRAMKMMKPTRAARTPSHGHIQLATVTDRHGIGVPRTSIASRRGSSGHSRKRDRKQHTHLAPSNSSGVAVKSAFPTLSRRYGQKSTGDVADYSQLDRMACSGVLRLRCVSNNITDLQ